MVRLVVRLSRTLRLLRAAPSSRRALAVQALCGLALTACVQGGTTGAHGPLSLGPVPQQPAAPAPGGPKAAILLPLSGPNAAVGQAMLQAAQLALAAPGSPELVPLDTHGTPDGAAAAARGAVAAGAGIVLGPLTAAETGAAGAVTRAANIPMLAFTSDPSQAQPGVWPLGITPAQQIRPLMFAMRAEGKLRLAAVLPQGAFGDALSTAMLSTAAEAQMPPPQIVPAAPTLDGFKGAMRVVTDYATRGPAIEAQQHAAHPNPATPADPSAPPPAPVPPPPIDALFFGATGSLLGRVVPLLAFYNVVPTEVRVLGPATWLRDAANQPNLAGALFAAPDPAARAGFEQQYAAKYGMPARDFTSLAYDAGSIARVTATPGGFPLASLNRPDGFTGADGLLALQPGGVVRRGLAVFEVDRTGSHIAQPAPQTLAAPGA